MTTFDHTYTPEGTEAPVTIKVSYPEGSIPADKASDFMPKSAFASELARRTDSIVQNKRDDEEYKTEILAHWGIDPNAKPGENDASIEERLTAERATWETTALKPIADDLATATTRIGTLLGSRLQAEILQESGNVKEPFRTAPRAGAKPAIVSTVDPLFRFSEEHDAFFVADGPENFAFTKAPKEGSPPFMGVAEFMSDFLGQEANRELLADTRQRGPGVGDVNKGNAGEAAYTLTKEQASDPAQYRVAKKAAKEAGRAMPIVLQQ